MTEPSAPTAFVTWAHRNHAWSEDREAAWAETIATFAALLILNGVDADVDLYHQSDKGINWDRYGMRQILERDLVLIAVSEAWINRFDGTEVPTAGAGAAREADTLMGVYTADRSVFERKTALVYLPGVDTRAVPPSLSGLQRFTVRDLTADGINAVLRWAHGAPVFSPPPLGPRPTFDPPAGHGDPARTLESLSAALGADGSPSSAAAQRGIRAALDDPAGAASGASAPGESRLVPPSAPVDPRGWVPVDSPRPLLTTVFDETNRQVGFGPFLEVQLLPLDDNPRQSAAALRALGARAAAELAPPASVSDPLLGRTADTPVVPSVEVGPDSLTVSVQPPRGGSALTGRASVTPSQIVGLTVVRSGAVAVTFSLRRDLHGAVVSSDSLKQDIQTLIAVGSSYLPVGLDSVVPVVRMGPLQSVSPGDPAADLGSGTRTFRWHAASGVTSASDSVAVTELGEPETAAELTAQLGAVLR